MSHLRKSKGRNYVGTRDLRIVSYYEIHFVHFEF